jgi:hypothetical protein
MENSSHSVGDVAHGLGAYSRDPLSWWDGHPDAVDGFPAVRGVQGVGGDNPKAGARRSPYGGAELDRPKLKRSVLLWIRRTLGGEVVRCLALVSDHPVRLPD